MNMANGAVKLKVEKTTTLNTALPKQIR